MDTINQENLKAHDQQPAPKQSKKWRIILVGLLVILASAAIVVGVLALLKSKPTSTTSTPVTQIIPGPDPKEVITKIATNPVILNAKNYTLLRTSSTQTAASPDTTTIIFKQNGYAFVTNVTPDDGLRLVLKDSKIASEKDALANAIRQVFKDASFTQTRQDTSLLSAYDTISYVNGGTTCQLINYANGRLTGLEQSVYCVGSASMQASYSNVSSLLQKADPSVVTSARAVSQETITSGTKKLTLLTVQSNNSKDTVTYYFATLDKEYQYLGKRATPSVDNAGSYTLPADLKKNISDPKWGTFLTDNIS